MIQAAANSIALRRDQALWVMRLTALALFSVLFLMVQSVHAQSRPSSFADLAEDVAASVVNITTTTLVEEGTGPGFNVPEGSPFEEFFRDFNDRRGDGGPRPRRSQALGSGFVISEDGFVVTNNHVIAEADEIVVEFTSGKRLTAEVIGADAETDIAVLKVEPDEPLPFVRFGDSDTARVGDWVLAVGNPLGQGFSVSAGIVSQRNRELSGAYDDFIQTDAAINRGNSGGPLFNMDGEVIGVNTAILSPTGGSIGIGFSMASNVVTRVVDQLREFGETRRGWLGVVIQDVTSDIAESIGLTPVRGALISEVPPGPAAEAGIVAGDVILSFDGQEVDDTRGLVQAVGNAEVGKVVRVMIFRDGATQTLAVTLGRRETANRTAMEPTPQGDIAPAEAERFGMTLWALDDERRAELGLEPDVAGLFVAEIDEASEAFEKGLRPGDLITDVAQEPVASIADFDARVALAESEGRRSILLLLRRDGAPRFIALSVN